MSDAAQTALQVEYPGAMYHVMSRGDRREDIFLDDMDRHHKLLGHVFSGRYQAQLVQGGGSGYLRRACDYVHLNPGRGIAPAGLGGG